MTHIRKTIITVFFRDIWCFRGLIMAIYLQQTITGFINFAIIHNHRLSLTEICRFYVWVLCCTSSNYTYVHIMASLVVILFGLIIKKFLFGSFWTCWKDIQKIILFKDNYTTDLICLLIIISKQILIFAKKPFKRST